MNSQLYQAIIERKSVRHYQKEPLTSSQIQKVKACVDRVVSLNPMKKAEFFFMDTIDRADLVTSLGGYGRILNAPHFVIPTIKEDKNTLMELGYQTQQFINYLTMEKIDSIRIGSCYIGALHRDTKNMHEKYNIPDSHEIASAVIFGIPKKINHRTIVNQMRKPGEKSSRKSLHEIFYQVDLDTFAIPEDSTWQKVLLAARRAPSATNAQPWRMIILEDELTIYADPQAYIPLLRKAGKTYTIHDIGILMANITQACQTVDWSCTWEIFDGITEDNLVYGSWTAISKAIINRTKQLRIDNNQFKG